MFFSSILGNLTGGQNGDASGDGFTEEFGFKESVLAFYFLGRAYFDGNGVEQNYAESAKFFQKAVDEFDLHSYDYYDSDHPRWLISRCPVVGRETRLFELVFEYIYDAWYHLGVMYWHGLGVAQKYEKAVEFFRQATEERNLGIHWDGDNHYWDVHYPVEAYSMLGNAYYSGHGVKQNYDEAVSLYRRGADEGSAEGMKGLGDACRSGNGTERNLDEALNWYIQAAGKDNAEAMNNLADMYSRGEGCTQDLGEAMKWCVKAAQLGNADAKSKLAQLMGNVPQSGTELPNS